MKKIFALLVGINDYTPPVSGLQGCLKDVNRIEHYLKKNFGTGEAISVEADGIAFQKSGSLHICRLLDEEATHSNIIKAFRQFLRQAGPEDAAWFHFSGHGSEAFTAEAFLELEPNGKDQTLVCFRPEDSDEIFQLADKELAVLLHEVATQDRDGRPKESSPHLVVSLDCCHSGSGTRDFEEDPALRNRGIKLQGQRPQFLVRQSEQPGRALSTYLDNYYAHQKQEKGSLEIPEAPHILLSACESIQQAGDLPAGGIFTSSLITTLEQAGGRLNYSDLFVRTRAISRKLRSEQTPKFETVGRFDPFTRFLDGSALGNPERYELIFETGRWFVKCGAVHGLPVQADQTISLEIQTPAPERRPLGIAHIEGVGAQKSSLILPQQMMLDRDQFYQAVIRFLPAPKVLVWLHGDPAGIAFLKDRWDASKNVQWMDTAEGQAAAELEVEATGEYFLLYDRVRKRQVLSRSMDKEGALLTMDALGKIVRWDRTVHLENPRSSLRQIANFELGIADKSRNQTFFREPEIRIEVTPEKYFADSNTGAIGLPFFPQLIVGGDSQKLYAYLFHLRTNYSIEAYEGEFVFRPEEHPGKAEVKIPLWKSTRGWGLSPGEDTATSYFKLIVTTAPLDYQQLLQSGLEGDRHSSFEWNPVAVDNSWLSFTTRVVLVRG